MTDQSTRRAFLTIAASATALAVPIAPARAVDEPPILADLSRAADRMDAADAAVEAAWGALDAAEQRFNEAWSVEHPEPAGKKRHRRWSRTREKARGIACSAEHDAVNHAESARFGARAMLATLGYQAVRS